MKHTTQDGFVWELVTRGQAIDLFKDNKEVFKLYADGSEAAIENELDFIDDYVMYGIPQGQMWARVDTTTGKGMNQGFCVYDGEAYFENESDLVKYLREQNVDESGELSDEFILKEAYDNGEYYYTEWDVEEEEYYYLEGRDGKLQEIWRDEE